MESHIADALGALLNRALGTRPIAGNRVTLEPDAPLALAAMLARIAGARERVLLENYIIRDDATGSRFADALLERAAAGVSVRVMYDAFGSRGTRGGYWRRLRDGGVDVRGFGRFQALKPFDYLVRNHRKLLVVDGAAAMVGGLCLGDEWAGDPARGVRAWRDSCVVIEGPAAPALERSAARTWAAGGASLPAAATAEAGVPGDVPVWVAEGRPDAERMSRAAHLLCDAAVERIWISDAYFVTPRLMGPALLDAARAGVDVRLLVPGTSDAPIVRDLTREGYRELLDAGVQIFEWAGPMLHTKTILVDHRWTRIGSTNLNFQSLYGNYELDVLLDSEPLAEQMAAQFRRDLADSIEIVRRPRRAGRPRLTSAGAAVPAPHRPTRYERRVATTIALRRVTWRWRRRLLAGASLALLLEAALLVVFPRAGGLIVALLAAAVGLPIGIEALRQRNASMPADREPGAD